MFVIRRKKDGQFFKYLTEGPCFTNDITQAAKYNDLESTREWASQLSKVPGELEVNDFSECET